MALLDNFDEYIFFFYGKNHLMWQMVVTTSDAEKEGKKLLEKYNEANEWPEEEKALTFKFCSLVEWIECLKERGKHYKDKDFKYAS